MAREAGGERPLPGGHAPQDAAPAGHVLASRYTEELFPTTHHKAASSHFFRSVLRPLLPVTPVSYTTRTKDFTPPGGTSSDAGNKEILPFSASQGKDSFFLILSKMKVAISASEAARLALSVTQTKKLPSHLDGRLRGHPSIEKALHQATLPTKYSRHKRALAFPLASHSSDLLLAPCPCVFTPEKAVSISLTSFPE